jgi:NTE family protein
MGIDAKALRRGKARKDQQALCGKVALNDGGNYDNFGLEPVWKSNKSTDPVRQVILVSDGGGTFDYQTLGRWFWQRWQRYASVQGIQGGNLRKRWLIERSVNGEVKAAYWGISSAPERYASNEFEPKPGYRKDFAERAIAKVRTDLDAFSEGEAMVLENHGYSLADAAVLRHLPELVIDNPLPYFLPHQSLLAENVAEGVLHGSSKRKLLGRS